VDPPNFSNPANLTDYTAFLYGVVGIPQLNLPPGAGIINTTLTLALAVVNQMLLCAPGMYVLAVYNLGADRLINYATDVSGQTYFTDLREKLRIHQVPSGMPSSANDQGTGVGILNPEWMKTMTLADLQNMRTAPGREYLGIALSVGTLYGIS
jgi:hypothetical protein